MQAGPLLLLSKLVHPWQCPLIHSSTVKCTSRTSPPRLTYIPWYFSFLYHLNDLKKKKKKKKTPLLFVLVVNILKKAGESSKETFHSLIDTVCVRTVGKVKWLFLGDENFYQFFFWLVYIIGLWDCMVRRRFIRIREILWSWKLVTMFSRCLSVIRVLISWFYEVHL